MGWPWCLGEGNSFGSWVRGSSGCVVRLSQPEGLAVGPGGDGRSLEGHLVLGGCLLGLKYLRGPAVRKAELLTSPAPTFAVQVQGSLLQVGSVFARELVQKQRTTLTLTKLTSSFLVFPHSWFQLLPKTLLIYLINDFFPKFSSYLQNIIINTLIPISIITFLWKLNS